MTMYVALLRGINVGGNKKVAMAELKRMFESLGFGRVQTYINSGNVVFETENVAGQPQLTVRIDALQQRIEQEIENTFGFPVDIALRTAAEWQQIVKMCPYAFDQLPEGGSIHLSLLLDPLSPEKRTQVEALTQEQNGDQLYAAEREIYFSFRQSILDSKLLTDLQKLKIPHTMRNWKTVIKLAAMINH